MKNITPHVPSLLLGLGLATVLGWARAPRTPHDHLIAPCQAGHSEDTIRAKKIVLVDDEGTTRLLLDGRLGRLWVYDPTGAFAAVTLSGEKQLVGIGGPEGKVYGWLGKRGLGVHDSKGMPRIGLGVDPDTGAMVWIDSDGDGEGRSLRE